MHDPKNYWEGRFGALDPAQYDFTQSRPSAVLIDFCEAHLPPGSAVLDLGCGGGRNAHYLAEKGYQVFGVDIAAEAIAFCRERFARHRLSGVFEQGTFDTLPFPDAHFAGVVCIAALDHVTIAGARDAVAEMRRVLAPDGMILVTFDPPDRDEELLDQAEVLPDGTLRFVRGRQAGMLFRRYTDKEITTLLGEQHIVAFGYRNGHRVIVCR